MGDKKVVIVGAGAAGLTAAIMCARAGALVTVLEQNEKPGKKICATGNGKCNYTNLNMPEDAYRGNHPEFVKKALEIYPPSWTVDFFEELGIVPLNKNGYLYPRSGQAHSVVDVMCMEARHLGVKIKTNEQVVSITREEDPETTMSVWKAATKGWCYEGSAVILANGSKASSIAGSDGSGYQLAETLGHRIIPPVPGLTALKCKGKGFSSWSGVRMEGAISLYGDGTLLKKETGELQLTEYGVSGIPSFQVSRYAARAMERGQEVKVVLDFLPDYSQEELLELLEKRKKTCSYKNEKELLTGLFPDKLCKVLLGQKELVKAIKSYSLTVTGVLPFAQAQVCAGGVDTLQVDESSMESKILPGLFFAGEILDVDGACGGYNLQWAWASGAAAGVHAASYVEGREKD